MVALIEPRDAQPSSNPPEQRRAQIAPSGVIGMLVFILTELMFFAGLFSAFTITRASAVLGMWPPPGQPRLPAEQTMLNTAMLLASGLVLAYGHKVYRRSPASLKAPLIVSIVLGLGFVGLQGVEWVQMLAQGLTMQSSAHGAFFYLIVGAHGLHAVGALIGLGYVLQRQLKGTLKAGELYAAETFWYFVVLLWPVLYARVYF